MKAEFKKLILSLMSRKFLMTALGAVMLYLNHQYSEMVVLLLGYIGVQGASDIVQHYKGGTLTASDIENAVSQNIDESKLVTGTGSIRRFDQDAPTE